MPGEAGAEFSENLLLRKWFEMSMLVEGKRFHVEESSSSPKTCLQTSPQCLATPCLLWWHSLSRTSCHESTTSTGPWSLCWQKYVSVIPSSVCIGATRVQQFCIQSACLGNGRSIYGLRTSDHEGSHGSSATLADHQCQLVTETSKQLRPYQDRNQDSSRSSKRQVLPKDLCFLTSL